MDLAQRLQALRKEAHYSQEQLADLLGISRQAVSKWESGQGKPEIDNIIKLAELYHISTDTLLLGNPSTPAPKDKNRSRSTPRRVAALVLVLLAYPLSLPLSALLQFAEYGIVYSLWGEQQPGELGEAFLTQFFPLVSLPKAQLFFFLAFCLVAVLLFFWDGIPKKRAHLPREP